MTAALGNPFALGATGVQTTARYDRLALGASFRPGTAALAAVSGVLVGPAGTMGDLTLLSDTLLRTDPFLAVVQGTHNTQQGQYLVPNVTQRDLAVPAKDASLFRKALVRVRVADSLEAGVASSASTDGAWLEVVSGDLAASNPALPAVGPNALALGELSIPSSGSGQPVTLTRYNPRTGSRTGILPVPSTDTAAPAFDGQYRDHPVRGLERGQGAAWEPVSNRDFAYARLRQTAASGLYPSGWGDILLQGEDFDSHNGHANASTFGWTCPAGQAGLYRVSGTVGYAATGAGLLLCCRILKNGTIVPGLQSHYVIGNSAGAQINTGEHLVSLAVGDVLLLQGYVNSANWQTSVGGAGNEGVGSTMTIQRIR